jgi:2-desacetyl-2-hydroxyethyl bacteriochlorophyllide A dehydrogenase
MISEQLRGRIHAAIRRHVLDALDERGLARGMRLEFVGPGNCELRPFEEAAPGPGEVLVETLVSAVSAGTERAYLLSLENTGISYPYVAGYSQVGRVVASGYGNVPQPGELVASSGPHASLHLTHASRTFVLPRGVSVEHASLLQMGFIALQGVRKAAIVPGEQVLVLGCGLIGQLAAQFAVAAGGRVTAAARSPERLAVSRACGIPATLTVQDRKQLDAQRADVIIDATGVPGSIHDAVAAAARGGRIVLLGSNRGISIDIDQSALRSKRLTIVGAHVASVPAVDSSRHAWPRKRECELFLDFLARGRLHIDPLITRRTSPTDCAEVYRDLAEGKAKPVAILFDWRLDGPWRPQLRLTSPLRALKTGIKRAAGRAPGPPPVFQSRRHDDRKLRFGLIGCGEIAAENALRLRDSSVTTIAWAVDLDISLARSLAAATGARAGTDAQEMLASSDVDAVLISAPHHVHATLTIQALEAGKHVVVEKPMALTADECDAMMAAARRHGRLLSVCYCQRYEPKIRRARELIAAGAIGSVLHTRMTLAIERSGAYWTGGLTGRSQTDWRRHLATAGGGVLMMNACHLLDYMAWLTGDSIAEVASCAANLTQGGDIEDTISLSYRYVSGAVGTLDVTNAGAGPAAHEIHLIGPEGQLVVAPSLRFWSKHAVLGYEPRRWHAIRNLQDADPRRHFFEAFAVAVLDGGVPPVRPEEARHVQAVIDAAYLSAASGRTVPVGVPHDVATAAFASSAPVPHNVSPDAADS